MCALALFKIHLSPEKQNNCWGKKKKKKSNSQCSIIVANGYLVTSIILEKKRYLSPECDTEPDGKIFSYDSYTIISHLFHFV